MKEINKKNNIVFIGRYNHSEDLSGPEKTAKRIFSLASAEYKTCFIQYFFDGKKYSIYKKLFGLEEETADNKKIYTAGLIRLFMLLLKLKPSVIHIITFERFAVFAVYYSMLWKKVKVIYNAHGLIVHGDNEINRDKTFYGRKNRKAEKLFLDKAKKIIFPSENAVLFCQKYYKFDERKSVIIPSGIDEVFHKLPAGAVRNGIVILTGGPLHESGRSFMKKYLKNIEGNIHLFIIGNKKYFAVFTKPGIFTFERMHGPELARFYEDKDIFLSLNEYDTFSMATAEAMTAGLIPIVTKQTGISSMIFNNVNGFVIEYDDVKGLTDNIDKLRSMNPVMKETMRNNAKSVYQKISWDKVYSDYKKLYE